MPRLRYHLLDVFTGEPFTGNPLAVVPEGDGLSPVVMQRIAAEFNLSETVFVQTPTTKRADVRLRIFTPVRELPMAGHPTVGALWWLADSGWWPPGTEKVRVELDVGVLQARITWKGKRPDTVWFRQPKPVFSRAKPDVAKLSATLSLPRGTITGTGLQPMVVSCGVPYGLVPVADTAAVRFDEGLWRKALAGTAFEHLYVFVPVADEGEVSLRARMFAPALGVGEDPATGSAAGPLTAYAHRVLRWPAARTGLVIEQGVEMGRRSRIHTRVSVTKAAVDGVWVGGGCCEMGQGTLRVGPR